MSTPTLPRTTPAEAALVLETEVRALTFYTENLFAMAEPDGFTSEQGDEYDLGDVAHNMRRAIEGMELAIAALKAVSA